MGSTIGVAAWREDPRADPLRTLPPLVGAAVGFVLGGPLGGAAGLLLGSAGGWIAGEGTRQARLARAVLPEPGETRRRVRFLEGRWSSPTGDDVAVISFVDGWMVARGALADWAIRPCDVALYGHRAPSLRHFSPDGGWREIEFPGADRAFRAELRAWLNGPIPEGESVHPPSRPSARAVAWAGDRSAFWSLVAVLGFLLGRWLLEGPYGVIAGALGAIPAGVCMARWRRFGQLRGAGS